MKTRTCLISVALFLALFTSSASAATRYAWTNGNNISPYVSWNNAAHNIQDAIDVCVSNDKVEVASGTHVLTVPIVLKAGVTLKGYGGASGTILDASNQFRCVTTEPGSVLDGFTIRNGRVAGSGGGVLCDKGTVKNCTIRGNEATTIGGILCTEGTLLNCTIESNHASGAYGGAGIFYSKVSGCAFSRNSADTYAGAGASFSSIEQCTFKHNTSSGSVGGLYMVGSTAKACTVSYNVAGTSDGGAWVVDSKVFYSSFTYNRAGTHAGGLNAYFGSKVKGCTISHNFASNHAGGVNMRKTAILENCTINVNTTLQSGGGVYIDTSAEMHNCTVSGNKAERGGGVFSSNATVKACMITDNWATFGGGVYQKDSSIENCVMARNYATSLGGGVYSGDSGTLLSCTIVSNSCDIGGGYFANGPIAAQSCVIYHNRGFAGISNYMLGGGATITRSCLSPSLPSLNTSADPKLVNKERGDYRLASGSPCIDYTAVGPATDIRGVQRPLDGNNNTVSTPDCGAYEYINRDADSDFDTWRDGFEVSRRSDPTSAASLPYAFDDYNGDQMTDLAVYEESSGGWFVRKLGPTGPYNPPITFGQLWGGPGLAPVPGDYNGDDLFDLCVYKESTGEWFIKPLGAGAPIAFGQQWGGPSLIPVPGDYNGDGVYDLAVYQSGAGIWLIKSLGDPLRPLIASALQWGGANMVPVAGDYDGDGVWDLALYETTTGNWFIRSLGPGDPISFGQNWGSPGLWPIAGDFNADGVWDLAVYRQPTEEWFIRSLGPVGPANPPICFGQMWGGTGLDPVTGDYNGDGVHDLSVYQTSTGNWFIRSLGPIGPANPPITFGQNWGGANLDAVGSW